MIFKDFRHHHTTTPNNNNNNTTTTNLALIGILAGVLQNMKKSILIVLSIVFGIWHVYADATPIHYVAQCNQIPSAPYTSWASAASNVQDAINESISGDQVWIARGVYRTTNQTGFIAKDDISIYGGFTGAESSPSERCDTNVLTILSGDLDRNDLTNSLGFIQNIVTNTSAIVGKNSYHVLYWASSSGAVCELDGLYFSSGHGKNPGTCPLNIGDGAIDQDLQGGGICAKGNGHLILRNCMILGNLAGTGREGHYFYNKTTGGTGGYGGGIYSEAVLDLTNCTVSGNQAGFGGNGGAVYSSYRAGSGGSGGKGGGIYAVSKLTIKNSSVTWNAGGTGGNGNIGGPTPSGNGGMGGDGGGLYLIQAKNLWK